MIQKQNWVSLCLLFSVSCISASAASWCVNAAASGGCLPTIGAAVTAAAANDTISVAPGTYKEAIVIGKPLSLISGDPAKTILDATGLAVGIYVNGLDNPGLANVFISGFTVQNANFEGILVTNASAVTITGNVVTNNNKGLSIASTPATCPGIPAFEPGESMDCGEGVHLLGTDHATVANNFITNNSGGILITDETAANHDNLISGNTVTNNVYACGITLASKVPTASGVTTPFGVFRNTIVANQSMGNGLIAEGAGVGIFASAPGTMTYSNVVLNNQATGNGIPGISIHGHTPNQKLDNNIIIGNTVSGNGPDLADTPTPGPAGINMATLSPVTGTIISQNTVSGEAYGVVLNVPGEVHVQRNTFSKGIGVANLGRGTVNADGNWWGCAGNPTYAVTALGGCAVTSGPVAVTTWLTAPYTK